MFPSGVGLREVKETVEQARAMCEQLDPKVFSLADVPEVFDLLTSLQKLVGGAVVRMSDRYAEAGAWKRNGSKSPEDDIARKTGTSTGAARRNLGTSRKLGDLPGTDDAVRRGELSPDQAGQVASGASASPDDEGDLLRAAKDEPLHGLKRRAAQSRAKADTDREATRSRHHAVRRVSRWTDDDGLYTMLLKLPPDRGAEIDAAMKPRIDRAYADARDAGRFEDYEAYAADVAHRLLTGQVGDGPSTTARNQAVRPDRKVIARVDVSALNRGDVVAGEVCEIAGVGPVSVSAVRALLGDAALAVVFTDGVDILNVTHLGRQVTAAQRTALEARGYRCEVCGATHHLEIDHVEGWSLTKTTTILDLAWLCTHCHDRKTQEKLRLVGPVGKRRLVPPEDADVGPDPPDDLFSYAT